MALAELAQAALDGLHGMSVVGRAIGVRLACPRQPRATPGGYSSLA